MTARLVNIEELKEYIEIAFSNDTEIVDYFDPKYDLSKWEDASGIVYDKICLDYSQCKLTVLEINGNKAGYFVYNDNLLISFGLNIQYRNNEELGRMWNIIRSKVGEFFQCVLFSRNTRAIKWLNRCGMNNLLESVTILETSKN
jgi:hypothetical protein